MTMKALFGIAVQTTAVAAGAAAVSAPDLTCSEYKTLFDGSDGLGCGADTSKKTHMQVRPVSGTKFVNGKTNKCKDKKLDLKLDNSACTVNDVVQVFEQAGADVSANASPQLQTSASPIATPYWKTNLCPVNVHWHLGAEHRSEGQYDETMSAKGPGIPSAATASPARGLAYDETSPEYRKGHRCNFYDAADAKFTTEYKWKHCKHMKVGETYEVHWPHSALGACGTPDQFQTPFYDGVLCHYPDTTAGEAHVANLTSILAGVVGVQGQVFTVVNDEKYYYPDLMWGMIVDGEMGKDMAHYTGSTTGTSRSNSVCSNYAPITWQVDRKCHMISASTFDKMCADMKLQRDDMSDDLYAHGSRETVDPSLSANNHLSVNHVPTPTARKMAAAAGDQDLAGQGANPSSSANICPAAATSAPSALAGTSEVVTGSLSVTFDTEKTAAQLAGDASVTTALKKSIAEPLTSVSAADVSITTIGGVAVSTTSRQRSLASVAFDVAFSIDTRSSDATVAENLKQTMAGTAYADSMLAKLQTETAAIAGVSATSATVLDFGSPVGTSAAASAATSKYSATNSMGALLAASFLSAGSNSKLPILALAMVVLAPSGVFGAEASAAAGGTCGDMASAYQTAGCCASEHQAEHQTSGLQVVPMPENFLGVEGPWDHTSTSVNKCAGAQSRLILNNGDTGLPNIDCFDDSQRTSLNGLTQGQSGTDVSVGYKGGLSAGNAVPIMKRYHETDLCPVNVHWHLGAEHKSDGEFDVAPGTAAHTQKGPARRLAGEVRGGFRCHHYNATDAKFTTEYNWKHCVDMKVGETYEVHWPHSSLGACGTPDQFQTPFYDGVLCMYPHAKGTAGGLGAIPDLVNKDAAAGPVLDGAVGVQGQVFTIVNDEDYYYPNLMRGMIVDGEYGKHMTHYTGSTTGTSRNNDKCSLYAPITWQVDRKCHLISASTFDAMCAAMKAQRDDMSSDLHAHGSRELVADDIASDNHVNQVHLRRTDGEK